MKASEAFDQILELKHGVTLKWFLRERTGRDRSCQSIADELEELVGKRVHERTVRRWFEEFGLEKEDARRSA